MENKKVSVILGHNNVLLLWQILFPKGGPNVGSHTPIRHSLLKCDLAISTSRGGIYSFTLLNLGGCCDYFGQQNMEEVMPYQSKHSPSLALQLPLPASWNPEAML